jgi:hypothetical protein
MPFPANPRGLCFRRRPCAWLPHVNGLVERAGFTAQQIAKIVLRFARGGLGRSCFSSIMILKHTKTVPVVTPRDVMACLPVLGYGTLALLIWLAERDVAHWPMISPAIPSEAGFELTGPREVLSIFLPLAGGLLCFVSLITVALSTLSELADSRKTSRRKIAIRGIAQFAVSSFGLVLFLPVLGRILIWVLD